MTKIPPFRKAVVAFLVTNRAPLLEEWKENDWVKEFFWLDRSGLALPLAARLLDGASTRPRIPDAVLLSLERRLRDNQRRMSAMLTSQQAIQSLLAARQVRFCCLKGFSLIPDCYSAIRERHQVDFDLLIDLSDTSRAAAALESLGYKAVHAGGSGEMRFVRPWTMHLTADSWLYDVSEGPAVELHTFLWEPETELVDLSLREGWMEGIYTRTVNGVTIPCLAPEWQFLHLLLHVFRHLLDSWVRLLSTYEIAVILDREQENDELWHKVRQLAETDARLASACALVLSIVNTEFALRLPSSLGGLCHEYLSRESALWVEHFREEWLYADPPGTKLALLVQRQFCADRSNWRSYSLRRLFPVRVPHSLSAEADTHTRLSFRYAMDEMSYQWSRIGYHLLSDWNYVRSIARWKQLAHSSGTLPLQNT
jgi:hypothetical protein